MSSDKPSKATRAIELVATSGAHLWHDPGGEPYVDMRGEHGERRTLRVRSRLCRTWVAGLMYEAEASALGGQAATDAVDVLTAMAVYDGPEREVHVRLASNDGALYLDLGDCTWRAVRISGSEWQMVSEPPVRYRRPRGLRPLPVPVREGGGWDALRALLHEPAERDWILLVSWLVGTMHPSGPYPILALTGEQGAAKTTVGRLLRSIVDPSQAPLRSPPRNDRELVIAARNSHVVGLDNLSRVPEWLSDALCRIATGGGYSARELFTDGEEVIYADRRPIILTSIEDVATRGDLADRTIAVTLPQIPEHARRPERELYAAMDRIRPRVLGGLLDAASNGLGRLATVKLEQLPRMADFAEWVVACEPALPWEEGEFLASYEAVRKDMVEIGIEADAVATAVVEMLREVGSWSGRASDMLEALDKRRGSNRPPEGWPETPQAMGGQMTRAAPLLRSAGWDVKRGDGRNRRIYDLTRHEHDSASVRHGRHDAHGPSDHAGPERDNPRDNDDEADPGRHAEKPHRARDVTTRDDGDDPLRTSTKEADATEVEELTEEDLR